jgi:hypothetical protein
MSQMKCPFLPLRLGLDVISPSFSLFSSFPLEGSREERNNGKTPRSHARCCAVSATVSAINSNSARFSHLMSSIKCHHADTIAIAGLSSDSHRFAENAALNSDPPRETSPLPFTRKPRIPRSSPFLLQQHKSKTLKIMTTHSSSPAWK